MSKLKEIVMVVGVVVLTSLSVVVISGGANIIHEVTCEKKEVSLVHYEFTGLNGKKLFYDSENKIRVCSD